MRGHLFRRFGKFFQNFPKKIAKKISIVNLFGCFGRRRSFLLAQGLDGMEWAPYSHSAPRASSVNHSSFARSNAHLGTLANHHLACQPLNFQASMQHQRLAAN